MDLVEAGTRSFETGVRHPWERARLALVHRLIADNVTLRPGDAVLDVGCGDTFVVEQLAALYPSVDFYAVDSAFTDSLLQTYRARLSVPNVSLFQSLDAVRLAKPASVVLLIDVIEHVPDDVGFLRDLSARSCVNDETRILITVPSYSALFSGHDRFLGHYRRYSRRALRHLLDAAGLRPLASGYLFASLLPARVLQVLRERVVGSNDSPSHLATWRGGELAARAIAAVLTVDGRLALSLARVGIRIPGLSNFAVCRKSA
jgi:methyltransferase family protein